MKRIRGSSIATGITLLAGIVIFVAFVINENIQIMLNQSVDAKIVIYGIICLVLLISVPSLHILYLQPDGIAHTWLGIRYKKTPWDSITNVSRIYMGLRGTVLWITCDKAKPLQPTKDGVLPDSWSISYLWMKGRYFTLLDQKDVVGYIEEIYGPLDFDCLLLEK